MTFRGSHFSAALTAALMAVALLIGGCKKKREFNEESAQATVDHRHAMAEMDEVIKDVNTVIMEQYTLRGRSSSARSLTTSVCGVKLEATGTLTGKMTMTYDGKDCYGRTRTGKVIFTIEEYPLQKWKQKDCRIKIEYVQYNVQRGSAARSIRMDGAQTLINESGGTWFELWYGGQSQVVNRHTGNDVKVTFNGDKTSYFNVERRLTFTFAADVTSCVVTGAGNQKDRPNVEAWGISTDSDNFAAEVTEAYMWKTSCGPVAPVRGAVTLVIDDKEYDLKCRYGVNSSGDAVSESSGVCPFGWEVTWSRKKRTNSRLFGYY